MSDPLTTHADADYSDKRYLVISGDCHAGPPLPGFAPYLDPAYRDDFSAYCRARPNAEAAAAALQGDFEMIAKGLEAFMRMQGASEEAAHSFSSRASRLTAGLFDSKIRNECLDEEGIAAEVIYTDGFIDNHPPYTDLMASSDTSRMIGSQGWSHELRIAGARAYNRWLAEFCGESPERRAGAVLLPPAADVDAVVTEMQIARAEGLRGGFLVPPLGDGLPGYHDPHYDPIWSAAVDLGAPIAVHGGNGRAADAFHTYGTEEPLASVFHFTECGFFDRRPLWFFIWGGVLERFPELRLVFAEGLAHWVPQELQRLDEMYDMWNLQMLRDQLSLRPSEYWQRNCAITATFISRAEAEMRHEIHVPNLLWGSDYPHPEGTWPYTEHCLQHAFWGVPEIETRSILGTSAADLYGFDSDALQPLVERIGPMPATVARRPGQPPADYLGMGMR
ncbi:amidohydrolase [Myxococcota bacterium]|nr:amidohydrolase [Myxococcota bacterium]